MRCEHVLVELHGVRNDHTGVITGNYILNMQSGGSTRQHPGVAPGGGATFQALNDPTFHVYVLDGVVTTSQRVQKRGFESPQCCLSTSKIPL